MFLVNLLRYALFLLVPLSLTLTSYLYLYPVFHSCAFPVPTLNADTAFSTTLHQHLRAFKHDPASVAPFRLLALGDPQLEGDSSLPDPNAESFPHLSKFWEDAFLLHGVEHSLLERIRYSLHDLVDLYFEDIPTRLGGLRKRIDLVGNDFYLAHIYRTLQWWTKPTHVTVLGDLLGSQWIDDGEYASRSARFWHKVFKGGERLPDELTAERNDGDDSALIMGEDADPWRKRLINVAGNHDIGYAGDIDRERLERFERNYGRANYELRFQLINNSQTKALGADLSTRVVPELRIVVLNDMNLDTPASSTDLQDETYNFLNRIISQSHDVERHAHFTLLLTHIPLYKEAGVCVDSPFFDFFDGIYDNGVKEQNHLSSDASKGILEGIYGLSGNPNVDGKGLGRDGLILVGHDHEGCDVWHHINQSANAIDDRIWKAAPMAQARRLSLPDQPGMPGIREITVRSMMGDFGGNAGLLSLWFDTEAWRWQYAFDTCALGKQHVWWVVHVLDVITMLVAAVFCGARLIQVVGARIHTPAASPSRKNVLDKMSAVSSNGLLTPPGSGKKSLRKKKSRNRLNGVPLDGVFTKPE